MPEPTLLGRVRPGSVPLALVAIACAVLGWTTPAAAQGLGTTRVTAVTATIYARCDPASPARAVLERGATVAVDSVNEGWVLVHVTGGEQGCMRRTDLEPTQAIDRAAEARRAREVAQARGTPPSHTTAPAVAERAIISVNASYLTASRTFDDTRTFDLYAEQGSFTTTYDVEPRLGVDAGAFVRVWRNLAVGGAFTTHKDDRDLAITGRVPHPLLFNQPRSVEGTAPGTREETAIHLAVAYIVPVNRHLQVVVFGGPSFFTVKQSVVTSISFDEDYPFDVATFTGADVDTEQEQKTGFNIGADVGYYFTENVGVGGIVRFSQTKVTFSLGEVDAGGAMIGGGLRLRF
jgi:opacity protein-like surface antigen